MNGRRGLLAIIGALLALAVAGGFALVVNANTGTRSLINSVNMSITHSTPQSEQSAITSGIAKVRRDERNLAGKMGMQSFRSANPADTAREYTANYHDDPLTHAYEQDQHQLAAYKSDIVHLRANEDDIGRAVGVSVPQAATLATRAGLSAQDMLDSSPAQIHDYVQTVMNYVSSHQ